MPGNEVGDRVHNFFDQGSLSQDQRHTQFVAANWPGYNNNNNIWNASERQISGPVNTGPENYNSQQSDIERGQGNQFSLGPNGLNIARQNLRPEFIKSPSQLPQLNLNGFMHPSQAGHMRQNEANFLGVDSEPDRRNMTSRSPIPESQQRSGPHLTNSASFGGSGSPMNFNFFGGQHQVNGQQAGMMQSLPRQQPGSNDAQLQQQLILKQMELQRLQQLQNQSPVNGNMLRDTPNYLWPSQVNVSNMNWQQRGVNSSMPGYSNGFMISPEQGQAMQFMGLIPQQTSQSLYGVPVSNSRSSNAFSGNQVPAPNNAFSGNQYNTISEQGGVKEGNMVPRYGSEGNSSFEQASSQRLGNVVNLGGFIRNSPMSEGSGQGFGGGTELVTEKYMGQASSSQDASTEAPVGLDPTEEKILFGSDDNIWEAFGGAGSGDATDLLNGFPSMQSGTWSALMQSAVAETTSTDGGGGVQEEWSGVGSQNSRPESGSQHPYDKSQHNMAENSQRASGGPRLGNNDLNVHNLNTNSNSNVNRATANSSGQQQFLNQRRDYLQIESQITQKPQVEEKRMDGNSGLWGHQQSFIGSVPSNGGLASNNQNNLLDKGRGVQMGMIPNSNIKMWRDNDGAPGLSNMKVNLESSQNLPENHRLDLWKSVSESSGGVQHNLNKGLPILESSNNNTDGGVSEIPPDTENGDRRESSSDSHRNSFPPNRWSDSSDRRTLSGKEMSSIPSRKFQYHPMGDVDVNLDSSFPAKQVLHSQSMSQNISAGGQGQGQEANPNFLGSLSTNIRDMGRAANCHGPVNLSRGGPQSGYLHNMSATFGPSGEISSSNQPMSPSQNMLELFNKVDQSKEQNAASRLKSSEYNTLSDASVGGVAGPSQSHLSASHGFSLQLAPPSQGIALSNLGESVHNSSRTMGSPSTGPLPSEKGDKSHSWLPSMSHQPTQMDFGVDPGMLGKMDADVSFANSKDSPSISSSNQSQQLTAPSGKIIGNQSVTPTFDKQSEQLNDSQRQAVMSHPVSNARGNLLAGREMNQPGVRAMIHQMPDSFHTTMSGMSRKDNLSHLGNIWASQQHLLGSQGSNASDLLRSQFHPPNNDASITSLSQQKKDEQDGRKRVDALSSQTEETRSQEEPSLRHQQESSPSCSGINQKDSTPNNAPYNYSLLNEMQTTKDLGSDPTHRESKRLKGEDESLKQIAGQGGAPIISNMNNMAKNPSMNSVSVRDSKILNFSPHLGKQNMLSSDNVAYRTDHTGISPQMAPSWFEQYGTFKNEQMQVAQNVPTVPIKNVEQQLIIGNPPIESVSDHLSSLRPKKRKTPTSDLLPWNKEIGQCLKRLQNLSSAEVDWARSSNRLIEKVEDETDNSEDLLSMTRPRRRLLLTTQLVQQVFQPPSPTILSLDASSNYEVILYSLARSTLGDACSCGVENNSPVESENPLSGKVKTSNRIQDQYFSKVVEDFESREKELENEMLRLDKHASILDFRLECQDLERFSVINRFARFHGRGQVDGAETSSSSDTNANVLKPSPQRYVSAHPMPRNVPERVNCLSL